MEPISSTASARASASQPPTPVQQRQDAEAISAPQVRSDSFATSVPGQDVQLQRRQVVEDISQNQKVTEQLQNGGEQLAAVRELARQASNPELDAESRQQLNERFEQTRASLNDLADAVERSGRANGSESRLRVETGIASADEARETTQAIDSALGQLGQDVAGLARQGQTLGADFPRTAQRNNVESPVQSSQEASRLAGQVQRSVREDPLNAVASQANVSRQTALTLFQ